MSHPDTPKIIRVDHRIFIYGDLDGGIFYAEPMCWYYKLRQLVSWIDQLVQFLE